MAGASVAKKGSDSHKGADSNQEWADFKQKILDAYPIDRCIEDFAPEVRMSPRSGNMDRKAACPFHDDAKPSMNVRPSLGYFKCHANSCQAGGDAFGFIMRYTGKTFYESVLMAAQRAGIEPPNGTRPYSSGAPGSKSSHMRRQIEEMNPARLLESDLIPAFRGIRPPQVGRFFPVWHPGSSNVPVPQVKKYKPEMVHVYRDLNRIPILVILRCRHADGGKYFMPIRVAKLPDEVPNYLVDDKKNRLGWLMKSTTSTQHRKPIYGLERTRQWLEDGGTHIQMVEGEKTCDASHELLSSAEGGEKWLSLSAMGGGNTALYADWTAFMELIKEERGSLKGLTFCVWPDADKKVTRIRGDEKEEVDPQAIYVRDTIGAFVVAARKAGLDPMEARYQRALPGTHRVKGWDLDDAKNEGWTGEKVIDWMMNRGMAMAVESRFLDLDVDICSGGDPTPFEDGPEDPMDLGLSGQDDGGNEVEADPQSDAFFYGFSSDDLDLDLDEEEELGSETAERAFLTTRDGEVDLFSQEVIPHMDDEMPNELMETLALTEQLLGEDGDSLGNFDALVTEMPAVTFDEGEVTSADPIERPVAAAEIVDMGDAEPVEADELIDAGDNGDDLSIYAEGREVVRRNPYFRSLGYRNCQNYYMSLRTGQIFCYAPGAIRKNALLSLAPLDFWGTYFVSYGKDGRATVEWDAATSAVIDSAYDVGYWDPKKEAGQGARIDQGRVVFNTGDQLWIQQEPDGPGLVEQACNFFGEYHYTVGDSCGMPDFDAPFVAGDQEPRDLLDLISKINWRDETRNLSIMSLFGWLCISPICGVLPWRPHVWLDGQRSAGKSWIIENIISPTLGDYALRVKSNSTESGLRNMLHSHAFPLVFDEAEGGMDEDRKRVANILALARHSATPGDSIVAQGVPGGSGMRYYSIASTFLMASITPQIEQSADKTRFARAKLGPGHALPYFSKHLEQPAMELLTQSFSAKMIARMVIRAGSIAKVQALMVRALTACGIERRLADVYGTYAAGAYLLLEDGVPEDFTAALAWIEDTFHISGEITEIAGEISDEKDHVRLFRRLIAHPVRCESNIYGNRNITVGALIEMAITALEDDDAIDRKTAGRFLADVGIRLASGDKVAKPDDLVDGLIIHKNSPRIEEILKATPWATSYVDVIQHAENVKNGPTARFGGLGTSRSVIVPIEHFPVLSDEDDYGDEREVRGG